MILYWFCFEVFTFRVGTSRGDALKSRVEYLGQNGDQYHVEILMISFGVFA